MDYSFINIPAGIWAKRFEHSFIYGGCRYPVICGTTETVIGVKSEQYLGPGYVWAPYIPIDLVREVFQPTQSISSRYRTRQVNPNFYGRITVDEPYNGVQLPKVNRVFS